MKSLSALDIKKSAIVIVDLQKGYCDPQSDCANLLGWDVSGADAVAQMHVDFLKTVREIYPSERVIWLRMEEAAHSYAQNTPYGPHLGDGFAELCVRGTAGHEYHIAKPQRGEPEFVKFHASGFSSKEFSRYLESQNITQLIFTGVIASRCVNATLVAASALGYGCIILNDLVAGPSHIPEEIEQHMKVTGMFYAVRTSSLQFIDKINELHVA